MLSPLSLHHPRGAGVIVATLQIRKLRFREFKQSSHHSWQVVGVELYIAFLGRDLDVSPENLFPILESPDLKCLRILPVLLRGRHCLGTHRQRLLRGVRGSLLMDCISKIRMPAISQSLMERDLPGEGGARLGFKHTRHPHWVHSSCPVLLPGVAQVPTQKSPPQRGLLRSALHHTLPLTPL